MKKLQNNFTTPKQSKRLLELGVPADSADMFYSAPTSEYPTIKAIAYGHIPHRESIPCWSVGRLIEIYTKCFNETETLFSRIVFNKGWSIDSLLLVIKEDFNLLDFSKLEE